MSILYTTPDIMSYINTSQAAKILGVSKKTLLRWDEAGKFSPIKRESLSKTRVYEEATIKNLRLLIDHEKEWSSVLNELHGVMRELKKYEKYFLLDDKQIELQERESKLLKEKERLYKEFLKFDFKIKQLYRRFYMDK